MTVTVRFALEAERTLDAIEARWNSEHGLLRENPLMAEVSRTAERLRANPEIVDLAETAWRSSDCFSARVGTYTTRMIRRKRMSWSSRSRTRDEASRRCSNPP